MRYFVRREGTEYGPFQPQELVELIDSGAISVQDLAAPEGDTNFRPIAQLGIIQAPPVKPPEPGPAPEQTNAPSPTAATGPGAAPASPAQVNPYAKPEPPAGTGYTNPAAGQVPPGQVNPYTDPRPSVGTGGINPAASQTGVQNPYSSPPPKDTFSPPHHEVMNAATPYRPKTITNLIDESTNVLFKKVLLWLLIGAMPIVIGMLSMMTQLSSLMRALPGSTSDMGSLPFSPGMTMQVIILALLSFYVGIASTVMTIYGAANIHDGADYSFIELFLEVQSKIPKYFVVILLIGLIILGAGVVAGLILPALQLFGILILAAAGLFFSIRLFPLPFVAVLEDVGFADIFGFSMRITKGCFWHIIKAYLVLTLIMIFMMIAVRFTGLYGYFLLPYIMSYSTIFLTLLYKDLVQRARLSKENAEF